MLNKNITKRPDMFEVSRIPCVRKAIFKFIEENNCKDEVIDYFDGNEGTQAQNPQKPAPNQQKKLNIE